MVEISEVISTTIKYLCWKYIRRRVLCPQIMALFRPPLLAGRMLLASTRAATVGRPIVIANAQCRRWATSTTKPQDVEEPQPEKVRKKVGEKKSMFDMLTSWMKPNDDAMAAVLVFEKSATQSKQPNFYKVCQVNPDFMGRVSLISLHVWMIHTRLKSDAYESKPFVHHLYEQMWLDVEQKLLDEGISAWLLSKHLNEVQQVVIGSLMTYDVTFQTFQNTEDCRPFLGALWRNVYAGDMEVDRVNLVQMRDYVFQELDNIMYTDEDMFYAGKLEWGSPPSTKAKASEESESLDISLAQNTMFKETDKFNTWT